MSNVNITQQEIEKSKSSAAKKVRTIHQQPVYRCVKNMLVVITQMRRNCPVAHRSIYENIYREATQLLTVLSLAYMEECARIQQLSLSAAHLDTIRSLVDILNHAGGMSKVDYKRVKSLATQCTQQVLAWRADYKIRVLQSNTK